MREILHIGIDDRERNKDLLEALRGIEDVELVIRRLEIGDFEIEGSVLIERKTAADFAASLMDGRLFSQASRMVQSPLRPAYIIEGDAHDWNCLNVTRSAIQGALISLMLIFDIPVLRSTDAAETARLACYAGRQLIRARRGTHVPTRQLKAKRKATRQRRMLQAIPGVGPDRANQLLETFGSVRACLAADEDTLASIPGIGPVTARRIIETVEETQSLYGADSFLS